MNEEETLAALSDEAKFELIYTVEPQPPKPRLPRIKPTKGKKKKRTSHEALIKEVLDIMNDPSTLSLSPTAIARQNLPSFKVTARATIFGRKLEESYENCLPESLNAVKEELRARFEWYVKNVYLSKRIALGNETTQVSVRLNFK